MGRSITRLTFWSACLALSLALLADAQEPKVDYEIQIQPIFTTNCAVSGCHTGETLPFGGFAGAGMILSAGKSYDQLVGVPSKLDSSRFSRVVAAASAASLITLKLEGAEGRPTGGRNTRQTKHNKTPHQIQQTHKTLNASKGGHIQKKMKRDQ